MKLGEEISKNSPPTTTQEGQGKVVSRPKFTIDKAADFMEKQYPEIWKNVNCKFIEAPGTHYSFKAVAVSLGVSIAELKIEPRETAAANIAASATVLAQHNFPTYYVSEALVRALLKTHPPKEMAWSQLDFPFPAMIFMLPKGVLKEPDGEEIIYVGFARHLAHTQVKIFSIESTFINPWNTDRISIFWSVGDCMQSQDCTFVSSQLLEPDPDYIEKATEEFRVFKAKDERPTDAKFTSILSGLVANLILLKMARPEMVEPGEKTKKTLKSGLSVHRPTWIGRKYEIIRKERIVAGGHFTELDWRSGHYKIQHFGPGRKESKVIFVDPYIAYVRGLVRKETA